MSLRAAINQHCRDCVYDPKSGLGNWRQQVTACSVRRCALYPVRPVSRGSTVPSGADLPPEQTEGGQP